MTANAHPRWRRDDTIRWVLETGRFAEDHNAFVEALGARLLSDGAPVWRLYAAGGTPGVAGAGSFVAPFGLPLNPALLGLEVFAQCAVPDAGTPHPSQVALSNALSITFHN